MASDPFARDLPKVDEQLATLADMQADCAEQLASVRHEITTTIAAMRAKVTKLQDHELTLMSTYETRQQRIDGLLDERLRAATAEQVVSA